MNAPNRPPSERCIKTQALWDDPDTATQSLGCSMCVDKLICGGAHKEASFYDCDDYCTCTNRSACDLVCRRNVAQYVERVREVDGFDLNRTPRASRIAISPLPSMIPVIEHKSGRSGALRFPIVCLPLYDLIDLDVGTLRYPDRVALAEAFGIDPLARLVISGVGRDRKIERYWALANRPSMLRSLEKLGITLITPPNFSVLTNVPRTDNFHAMKRIMIAVVEMAQAGLPTALHVNARTEMDYQRWAAVIADREEISCLTAEFATGAGRGKRINWHVGQLCRLSERVGRPLQLVVRGGLRAAEPLREFFDTVTILDTDAFSKTRCRKRAHFSAAGKINWANSPTMRGQPLDELLQHNVTILHSQHTYLERLHADRRLGRTSKLLTVPNIYRKAV